MPLQLGTTLGSYQVTAKIGEGGMGEVYRARDTKLDRDVALKVLPPAFTDDPDRLARFEREAKVLASLNHPNIGHIYGLEEAEGTKALVLELVEGPTLADRITQGAIPVDEALPIARQIAEALEAAHEQGVIHRDLKPANIKIRPDGTVKVLDFGLAKAFEPEAGSVSASMSPTISLTAAATQMGMVIGTAAYMAPEQAKGKVVDKRADVWAFGAVLYEMLSGKKPFFGDDVSTTLARVIEREPDWDALPSDLSQLLASYLRRCLEKEPKQRVHDIADVRLAMEGAFDVGGALSGDRTAATQKSGSRQGLTWVGGIVVGGIATGFAAWMILRPGPGLTTRLNITQPPGVERIGRIVLSQDGRTLAFGGSGDGLQQVYLRQLGEVESVPLRGTEGTDPIAFSPDGQSLVVQDVEASGAGGVNTEVKRVPLGGGPMTTLGVGAGAAWGHDDRVVLGGWGGLKITGASGGDVTPLTTLESGEGGHFYPAFLPGEQAVLFHTWRGTPQTSQVAVYNLETNERTDLVSGSGPSFVSTGHLTFWRDGSLWAVPFDAEQLDVIGDPVLVVGRVARRNAASFGYTVASDGTLVYQSGGELRIETLGWVDRQGEMTTPLVEGAALAHPRLSPDGTQVAFAASVGTGFLRGGAKVLVRDLSTARETKLTEVATNWLPTWAPDGSTIAFTSDRSGTFQLLRRTVDLSGPAEPFQATEGPSLPGSWTPDGTALVYYTLGTGSERDIWTLPMSGEPVAFAATAANERAARLSPDGKWVAYVSNQPGEDRVVVQAFPEGGQVFPVSIGLGTEPMWSRSGRELFYRSGEQLWVVDVETGTTFTAGNARVLFTASYAPDPLLAGNPNYDVAPDGQRFLMVRSEPAETQELIVVLNWFEELNRLVPVN